LDNTLIFIGSGALLCLMPLAVYLLYLSHLNRRIPPTLVSGPWDFGGVLLGLAGFLILSGPLLLSLVHSAWRSYLFGNWAALRATGAREALAGSLMSVGYLIVLATLITFLLRRRRPVTAIYNVMPDRVEETVVGVLEDLSYSFRRTNGELEIATKKASEPVDPASQFFPATSATLRIDRFPSMAHATLRWGGAYSGIRPELEAILPAALPPPVRNSMAGWTITAALAVMVAMLLWLVVLVVVVFVPPPN
jgi:hypothetical protein